MGRLLDLDDFLDPKSLTPQQLYKLQSETWAQGAENERERIIKLLESNNKLCTEKTVCIEANEGYPCNCTDLIALIKGE